MQDVRFVKVNDRKVPVLISDEKEALLAAQAAGRAVVGLWRPGQDMDALGGARYVLEDMADATDEYIERIVKRHLSIPWTICETERLLIREMTDTDFELICDNKIGPGLETPNELRDYVKNQYGFYEFGFWLLTEKKSGRSIGAAGLLVPEINACDENTVILYAGDTGEGSEVLELGYHIFTPYRRQGFAQEACRAIMEYGKEYLGADGYAVRIRRGNEASMAAAKKLGFR